MQALEAHPELTRRTERVTAATLAEHLASPEPPVVIDIRTNGEWQEGRIEGSLHIPLNHLQERMHEAPRGRRLVLYCAGGYRSSIASSLLQQYGIEDVADLVGGIEAWEATRQHQTGG